MDLNTISTIVGTTSGIIGIVLGLRQIIIIGPGPGRLSQFTKLLFAVGIVLILYGSLVTVSSTTKAVSIKQACLLGKNANDYSVQNFCNDYTNTRLEQDIKPGLLFIGIGLALIALTLFFHNYSSSTVIGFVFQIVLFLMGLWLIKSNF